MGIETKTFCFVHLNAAGGVGGGGGAAKIWVSFLLPWETFMEQYRLTEATTAEGGKLTVKVLSHKPQLPNHR